MKLEHELIDSAKYWSFCMYPFLVTGENVSDRLDGLINTAPLTMHGTSTLYVHIPFCDSICAFCPFAKTIYNSNTVDKYLDGLEKEIKMLKKYPIYSNMVLDMIAIGGGSPSSLNAKQLTRLLDMIVSNFTISNDYEWSMECEPRSFTEEKAIIMKEYGINRVSLGVQTLNEKYRKMLNLTTSITQIEDSLTIAKKHFPLQNLDILFALPGQTEAEVLEDIQKVMDLGSTSIETNPLVYASCTATFLRKISKGELPRRATKEEIVSLTDSLFNYLRKNDWYQFHVLTHFAPHVDKENRRFRYFESLFGKVTDHLLGIGASSVTYLEGVCYANYPSVDSYLNAIEDGKLPVLKAREYFAYEKALAEFPQTMMLSKKYYEKISKIHPYAKEVIESWMIKGYLDDLGDHLRIKDEYRAYFIPMSNQLVPEEEREAMASDLRNMEAGKINASNLSDEDWLGYLKDM